MRKKMYLPLVAVPVAVAVLALAVSYTPYFADGKIVSVSTGLYANIPPEEVMRLADVVVIGKVVGVDTEVYWADRNRGVFEVYTMYEIEPEEFVKGHSDRNLIVRVMGGETDEYKTVDENNNMFLKDGDRAIMHLGYFEEGMLYLPVGWVFNTYLIGDDGIAGNARNKRISLEQLEDNYDKILENMTRTRP